MEKGVKEQVGEMNVNTTTVTITVEDEKKETIVRKEVPNDISDAFKRQKFEQRKSPKYDRRSPRPNREDRKSIDPSQSLNLDVDHSATTNPIAMIAITNTNNDSNISKNILNTNDPLPIIEESSQSVESPPHSPRNSRSQKKSPRAKEETSAINFTAIANLESVINLELNLGALKYTIVRIFQPEFSCRCVTKWFFNSSSCFVSGSLDGVLSIIDADSQKVTMAFKAHQLGGLLDFTFSSTPNDLVVTTSPIERCVNVYQITKKNLISEIHVDVGVTCVCWNSQPNHSEQDAHKFPKFITGNEGGKLNVYYGTMTKDECYQIDYPRSFFGNNSDINSPITCLEVIVDDNNQFWICAGNLAGRISIFKYDSGEIVYHHHLSLWAKITSINYNLKTNLILVNCDSKLKMFTFPTLELKKVIFHQQSNFSQTFLTIDGSNVVTGSDDGSLTVYNAETGEMKQSITIYPKIADRKVATLSLNTSPDGRYLTSTSSEGLIYLWQAY